MPGHVAFHSRVACYIFSMMTRGQVARRLGKSVATVRRMEGSQLHPRRDAGGVLRFNPAEVERVARAMRQGNLSTLSSASFRTDGFESDDEILDPEEIEHRERMKRADAESNAAAEMRRAERLRLDREQQFRAA